MSTATGVGKKVRYVKESAFGAVNAGGDAYSVRRVSCNVGLSKDTYESKEIREDYQVSDMRHGQRKASGKIEGELSPNSYSDFIASALRKDFIEPASTASSPCVFVAATQKVSGIDLTSFVGTVVRFHNAGSTAHANYAKNLLVTGGSVGAGFDLQPLDGSLIVDLTEAAIAAPAGAVSYVPLTGHTNDSYNIEQYFSDIGKSELATGCKVNSVSVDLPATGMSKISIDILGQDVVNGNAQVLTNLVPRVSSGVLSAANGIVFAVGKRRKELTSLKFSINGNMSTEPTIGSNVATDIFAGRVIASGEMTALFESTEMRDAFINEDEVSIYAAFNATAAANSPFVLFSFMRIKLGGSTKDDGEKGIIQTVPFTALLSDGVSGVSSTVLVQDSDVEVV